MTEEPGSERRRFTRRYIQFPVRYRFDLEGVITDWRESKAGNMSAGGLFVSFGEDLQMGKVLDLDFTIPGRAKPIKARATVVWVKPVVAGTMMQCGLEFSEISEEDRAFLDGFANQQESNQNAQRWST